MFQQRILYLLHPVGTPEISELGYTYISFLLELYQSLSEFISPSSLKRFGSVSGQY